MHLISDMFSFTKGRNKHSLLDKIFVINRRNSSNTLKYIEHTKPQNRLTKVDLNPTLIQPLTNQAQPVEIKDVDTKQFLEPGNSELIKSLSSGEATNLVDTQKVKHVPDNKKRHNPVDNNDKIIRPDNGLVSQTEHNLVSIKKIKTKNQNTLNQNTLNNRKRTKRTVFDYM